MPTLFEAIEINPKNNERQFTIPVWLGPTLGFIDITFTTSSTSAVLSKYNNIDYYNRIDWTLIKSLGGFRGDEVDISQSGGVTTEFMSAFRGRDWANMLAAGSTFITYEITTRDPYSWMLYTDIYVAKTSTSYYFNNY